MTAPLLEACVASLSEAHYAVQHGASRIELCANLHLDGTTPDIAVIREVIEAVQIPVKVMIRPRGGDFLYRTEEFEQMLADIHMCKSLGVQEIVTGVLHADHRLDLDRIGILTENASPMCVTIHRCIDLVPDIFQAIEELKHIPGITSILSSGQRDTAMEGAEVLRKMCIACGDRLTLIVAGKVTPENLDELIRKTGVWEYHGRRIV